MKGELGGVDGSRVEVELRECVRFSKWNKKRERDSGGGIERKRERVRDLFSK